MPFPQDFIEQLRSANPIDSVMSSYVTLKRSGRNMVCLCPFHSEKSPSCVVYNDTQSFYCFGCGAGGDVFTFTMLIENIEYYEAVRLLAERSGISMPENSGNPDTHKLKMRIYEANRTAAKYFFNVLTREKEGEKGRRYFAQRALKNSTIVKYGLGYAPPGWQNLYDHMRSKGFTDEELIAANLCSRSTKTDRLFDQFRDRVMFPIIDLRGNVVAFGGRVLDDGQPKYLNTSDTLVFKKSRNLFSLNFAKRVNEERMILAEGYMDVIAVNQAGFENVVATLGTALTPEQARIISGYAKQVIIAYDSDGPGQAAAHRAINLFGEVGIETKIIKMEGAKDPDEYIKKFGAARFKNLLDNSDGAINFELNKCKKDLDLDSETGRVEYLKRCINVLADISSPVGRDVYASKIAAEQKVSKEVIISQTESVLKKRSKSQEKRQWQEITTSMSRDEINPEAVRYPKENRAETEIILFLSRHPDTLSYITSKLSPDDFVTSFNKKLYSSLTNGMKNSEGFNLMSLSGEFTAREMGKISEMSAKYKDIAISAEELDVLINILLDHKNKQTKPAAEMTDSDLLELQQMLKKKTK